MESMECKTRKSRLRYSPFLSTIVILALALLAAFSTPLSFAQDNVVISTNSGATSIRIAVADFKLSATDQQTIALQLTFDATLYADLATAGIFDIVSKSLMPSGSPGSPAEMQVQNYANAPASAAFVAFGSIGVNSGKLVVSGYLYDAKNLQYPQVFARQYNQDPTEDSARQIAHQFADEIILRLGGGIAGIAETKIYYVKILNKDAKEIWMMDYDGANQHAVTHLGSISISPARLARQLPPRLRHARQVRLPDQDVLAPPRPLPQFPQRQCPKRVARLVAQRQRTCLRPPLPRDPSTSGSPTPTATSPAHHQLPRRRSPTYNPKTGAQIAFVSDRTGLPQLYIMNTDGSGVQRMTDGGYASSPSWSPDGQFIAFAWDRKYGPGAPGGQDIYIMNVTTKFWTQLTHDGGRCDFPTWSPDGRHIAYANSADGRADHTRIWSMLADGTQKRPLTGPGADMPNWSWK